MAQILRKEYGDSADGTNLVSNLCELFAQMDVNGDGSLEWTEFTSFIVETWVASKKQRTNDIQKYQYVGSQDVGKPTCGVDKLFYFPENDTIVTVDRDECECYVYNSALVLRFVISRASTDGVIRSVVYLPERAHYVIASSDSAMSFYEAHHGMLVKSFRTSTVQICMEWVAEFSLLYTADMNGTIRAWDVDAMEEKYYMGGSGLAGVKNANAAGEEKQGSSGGGGHQDSVMCLLRLQGMDVIASASMDSYVFLWSLTTGRRQRVLEGHRKGVTCLAYIPEQRFLVSAGFEFEALVWNPYVQQLVSRISGHMHSICGMKLVAGTSQLITADAGSTIKIWDVRDFACVQTFVGDEKWVTPRNAPKYQVSSVIVIDEQKRVVLASGQAHSFECQKLENPDLTDDAPIIYAAYNATSLTFISVSTNEVKIWDAKTGSMLRTYKHLGGDPDNVELTAVCLDDRQRKFILGDHLGFISVCDYLNGADLKGFNYTDATRPGLDRAHSELVSKLVYCNEHKIVISASWDRTICVHDERVADTGILLRTMTGGHVSDISALAYSYNLSVIASGSSDGCIRLWDFEFGRLDGSCDGDAAITCIEFMNPFPLFVSADVNGGLRLWSTQPDLRRQGACPCVATWQNRSRARAGEDAVGTSVTAMCVHVAYDETEEENIIGLAAKHKEEHLWSAFDAKKYPAAIEVQDGASLSSAAPPSKFQVLTGDEEGELRVWDLHEALPVLEERYSIVAHNTPVQCLNPRRNIRFDAADVIKAQQNRVRTRPPRGSKETITVEATRSWRAHGEAISSVQRLVDPPGVVSGSFDRLVKIWSCYGECLGVLCQGSTIDHWGCPWTFQIDLRAVHEKQMANAKVVAQEMRRLESAATRRRQAKAEAKLDPDDYAPPFDGLSLQESQSSDYEPAMFGVRGGKSAGDSGYVRRTDSLRPIDARNAGRGISKRRLRKESK
jgi:WD40 repeat protein